MELHSKSLCILLAIVAIVSGDPPKNDCTINLNSKSAFPTPQPLLLKMESKPTLAAPDGDGNIILKHQENLTITCSGSGNKFKKIPGVKNTLEITCRSDNKFFVPEVGKLFSFKDFSCHYRPRSKARTKHNQKCGPHHKNTVISVGFSAVNTFLELYEVCFDQSKYTTLYTKKWMNPSIDGSQKGYEGTFHTDDRFSGIPSLSNLYKRKSQVETFSRALKSKGLANRYIKTKGNYFLSKGHLVAKADMIFETEQAATFHYINVVPQWQTLNGNNWGDIEHDTRQFVINRNRNLVIYTGTLGQDSLKDVNGVRKDLFLFIDGTSHKSNKIPIPRYIYKILYDPKTKEGVAFLGWNDPHVKPEKKPCTDMCPQLRWVKRLHDRYNAKKGVCFCCSVPDMQKRWPEVPSEIRVTKLLI